MQTLFAFSGLLALAFANPAVNQSKVVCYYDNIRRYVRESQGEGEEDDLDFALPSCTHLVYGYARIQPDTYEMVLDSSHANYRVITNLKNKYPGIKVLFSVGGGVDTENSEKYNLLLESPQARTVFVKSAVHLAEQHGFDGIDLAWQFAEIKPKKTRSTWESIWRRIKKFVTTSVDEEAEHREGFTALIQEMKHAMYIQPNKQLSTTVLPNLNLNASVSFNVPIICELLDFVSLQAYDFYTPERNPKKADYSSPIYSPVNRNPLLNIDSSVKYWLASGAPSYKIVLAISTIGRTWKLGKPDSDSETSGVPPLQADGPGEAGPYTKVEGILSYPEVCTDLMFPTHQKGMRTHQKSTRPPLRKVTDPTERFGTYAFRLPDDNGEGGLWVSYEDPDTAGQKAAYAKSKNLGGVAIVDLSMDDFSGRCTGDKYPILRAAKNKL